MPYLKRLGEVSVEGYVLHRLNKMVEEGADMSALVHAEDAGALFSACVGGVLACKESTWRCSALQREMVCTVAALARAGLVSRANWSAKAVSLAPALVSILMVTLHCEETTRFVVGKGGGRKIEEEWGRGGLCDWLHQLLRALAPAVSFEGAAKELSQASQVRALVDAAVKAANEGGKMGEEVVGCALHVLACVMALCHKTQQQDVVGIFLKDRHLLSLVKDLAEREGSGHAVRAGGAAAGRDGAGGGGGPASLFMAQLLAHPSEGEAVRLAIPEREFWARIEQESGSALWAGVAGVDADREAGIRAILPSLKWSMLGDASGSSSSSSTAASNQPLNDASPAPQERHRLMILPSLKWSMLSETSDSSGSPSHAGAQIVNE